MNVTFTIPYPKKLSEFGMNAIYAGKHWTKRQQDSQFWHLLVRASLAKCKVKTPDAASGAAVFDEPVRICFWWNDHMDIDNHAYMAKMIIDSLKGVLIADDSRRYVAEVCHAFYGGKDILVEVQSFEPQKDS